MKTVLRLLALSACLSAAFAQTAPAPALAGDWQGALAVGGTQLHLVLHITGANTALAATLDSPDQGAHGIPVTTVVFADNKLTATVAAAHATYTGTLSKDGNTLTGEWTQGQSLPLTLTRGTGASVAAAEPARPQNPTKPYPYQSIDVTYNNAVEHDTLAATLTVPPGKGPFPAVLLITGSGPQDRDETILGHKPFLVLSDFLTRHGIVVLRADDRGIGKSTGNFATATTADFATDAEAGLVFLESRPEVDPHRIGLLGHSEGGIIAPMVAARNKDVAFIVLLAGTGVPGAEVIADQMRDITTADVGPKVGAGFYASEKSLLALVVADTTLTGTTAVSKNPARLDKALRAELTQDGRPPARVDAMIAQVAGPWFRYFITYDPATALRHVTCPVLALDGSKDLQVNAAVNLPAIRAALAAGGNMHVEIHELPGLNHLFQTATTGSPTEYESISETFSPVALNLIGDFILKQK